MLINRFSLYTPYLPISLLYVISVLFSNSTLKKISQKKFAPEKVLLKSPSKTLLYTTL